MTCLRPLTSCKTWSSTPSGTDSLDLPQIVRPHRSFPTAFIGILMNFFSSTGRCRLPVRRKVFGAREHCRSRFLPRGSGIVTRRPLILQLINVQEDDIEEPAPVGYGSRNRAGGAMNGQSSTISLRTGLPTLTRSSARSRTRPPESPATTRELRGSLSTSRSSLLMCST